jgi:hypothetical protein
MKLSPSLALLKNRLAHHVSEHLDPILLVLAMLLVRNVLPEPTLSWLAQLAALIVCVFISSKRTGPEQPLWRAQLRQLPRKLLISAVIAAVWLFIFSLPLITGLLVFTTWLLLAATILVNWRFCGQKIVVLGLPLFTERRLDIVLGEALLVTGILSASATFAPGLWPAARDWVPWIGLGWVLVGHVLKLASVRFGGRHLMAMAILFLGLAGWIHSAGHWQRAHLVVAFWLCGGVALYRVLLDRFGGNRPDDLAENFRWITLGTVGLIFFHPFLQAGVHGTGDALWYGTMLADMLTQIHAGVFPVFVGQSIYQFNGSIYPLRVAPLFHHAGALTDLLTGGSLDPIAVLNALLFGTGILALATAYFCLRALLPSWRWGACALAICYVGSPGTMGLVFNTDLFMSWMTVPWLPLVFYGSVLSFRKPDYHSLLILAGSLGLLWWGHSPVALWTTLIAALIQIGRLLSTRPDPSMVRPLLAAAALFIVIAAYPVGSVLLFPPEPGINTTGFLGASIDNIVYFLQQVRPAVWLPLSANGRALGDFQLGYTLWIALVASAIFALRRRTFALVALPLAAVSLAALLNLPAGPEATVWQAVPAFLRNTTGNWVMNRLYVIQAGLIVFGAAALLGSPLKPASRTLMRGLGVLALCGVLWTMAEAQKFSGGSRHLLRSPESGKLAVLPENIQITQFAYLLFPKPPAYFTHGVTTPELQQRLFSTTGTLITDNYAAAANGVELGSFAFEDTQLTTEGFLSLAKSLTLLPGHHYLLAFDFKTPVQLEGLVQIKGDTTLREYALPEYGEAMSFGHGDRHSPYLALPNNSATSQTVTVRYFPKKSDSTAPTTLPSARVRWIEYQPATLPVRVESWIPYRARVTAPVSAWLETPRMFQTTYVARVNGQPATFRKSPEGLVSIAVPSGESTVELRYQAPAGLSILYWISLTSILAWLTWLAADRHRSAE